MATTPLVTLRLMRPYRGYRSGEVIQATQRLAETLAAQGVGQVVTEPASLFDPKPRERAVAPAAAETR